jgi:alkaline phosphatase
MDSTPSRGRLGRRAATAASVGLLVTAPLAASAAFGDDGGDNSATAAAAIDAGPARNVILLIGDGMGDSEITSARNYQVGAAGRLALDTLPMTGEYTTYSVSREAPHQPDYVTDSAAAGTGWSTGTKSYNGAISVGPDGTTVLPTILELARDAGYATGNVSTAEIEDATPAVLVAHISNRDCKGPDEAAAECPDETVEAGGLGSIAEQLTESDADVVLGGGLAYFQQKIKGGEYKGQTVLDQAADNGYHVVTDADGLANASPRDKVLGLFAANNLDLEWVGPAARKGGTEPKRCKTNDDRSAAQPHLSDMAAKAIDLLDAKSAAKPKGFFLQIEGASIDKQDHAANVCGQIGETVEFDRAVKVALDYQREHPDTLVVVSADHGHTSQIVEAGSTTTGLTVSLRTADGAPMTISYATAKGESQQHTGTQVRIAAVGPQAANVLGITDQTDLFHTMSRALKLS